MDPYFCPRCQRTGEPIVAEHGPLAYGWFCPRCFSPVKEWDTAQRFYLLALSARLTAQYVAVGAQGKK